MTERKKPFRVVPPGPFGKPDKCLTIEGPYGPTSDLTMEYDDCDLGAQRRYAARCVRNLNRFWHQDTAASLTREDIADLRRLAAEAAPTAHDAPDYAEARAKAEMAQRALLERLPAVLDALEWLAKPAVRGRVSKVRS